jgi:hypothetical protein
MGERDTKVIEAARAEAEPPALATPSRPARRHISMAATRRCDSPIH